MVPIEWLDPAMLGGTWMPELIELAGGVAVGAVAGALAKTLSHAELAELRPDVVVIKPCGFSVARTLEELHVVAEIAATVGPRARVFVTDGNAYFNRPGAAPRGVARDHGRLRSARPVPGAPRASRLGHPPDVRVRALKRPSARSTSSEEIS